MGECVGVAVRVWLLDGLRVGVTERVLLTLACTLFVAGIVLVVCAERVEVDDGSGESVAVDVPVMLFVPEPDREGAAVTVGVIEDVCVPVWESDRVLEAETVGDWVLAADADLVFVVEADDVDEAELERLGELVVDGDGTGLDEVLTDALGDADASWRLALADAVADGVREIDRETDMEGVLNGVGEAMDVSRGGRTTPRYTDPAGAVAKTVRVADVVSYAYTFADVLAYSTNEPLSTVRPVIE